jgi:hypothetical protein
LIAAWLRIWGALANGTDYGIALTVAIFSRGVSRLIVGVGCVGALGAFALVGLPGGHTLPQATVMMVSRQAQVILVQADEDPTPADAASATATDAGPTATEATNAVVPPAADGVAAAEAAVETAKPAPPPAAVVTSAPAPVATAAPAPPPAPAQATGAHYTAAQVRDAARSAGWPETLLDQVVGVAQCESGLFSGAQGGGALGLMQIMPGWFGAAGVELTSWADPVANLAVARYVYNYGVSKGDAPWSAWACSP